jgi:hypothetical protein
MDHMCMIKKRYPNDKVHVAIIPHMPESTRRSIYVDLDVFLEGSTIDYTKPGSLPFLVRHTFYDIYHIPLISNCSISF